MKFTIYDTLTGRVLFGGTADEPDLLARDGQSIHEGDSFDGGYFDSGEHFPLPPQPSPFHQFDYGLKQWVDPRTLDQLKVVKNNAINAARLRANQSYFVFEGKQIAADPLSRSDIDAAHGAILMLQALPPGWPGAWKAMDNTFVAITTIERWGQFYGTMVATGTANFAHAQALKAQLLAASTPAEVEAVPDW